MGSFSDYTCTGCGYRIDEMVSGYDVGMVAHVVGVRCFDCNDLQIASIPGNPWDDSARNAEAEISAGRIPEGVRCRKSTRHRIAVWVAPGPCPKCGAVMEPGSSGGIWD